MKLFLTTWATDEYFDDIKAAYVEITREDAQVILKRAKAFKKFDEQDQSDNPGEGRLLTADFWDNDLVHFLSKDGVTKEELEQLDGVEFISTERAIDLDKAVPVENVVMHITHGTVYWTCTIEYTGIEVSTEVIPFGEIEKAL